MNNRLKTIVNLEKYPIQDLRLSNIRKIIKKYNKFYKMLFFYVK